MEAKPTEGQHRKKTVLLAEDNGINQLTTKIMLKNMGFEVVCAENGKEAAEFFEKESIDLILMDIQMPIMNGMEAAQAIRKTEKGAAVPIVALTAYALKGDRERILASGMNDYIAKPCTGQDIFEVIKKYLNI